MKIAIAEGRLTAETGYAARAVMKTLPGARWSAKMASWTYPLAYPSALTLSEAAKRLRESVQPDPEALDWVMSEKAVWDALTIQAARVKFDGPGVEGFFPHQVQCAEWLAMDGAAGGRLDTSETGSGKTRSALRAAWKCWTRGETGILLIATLVAVKYGWRKEVENVEGLLPLPDGRAWQVFTVDNDATVTKRRKTIEAAQKANEKADGVGVVLLVNHEQLRAHSRMSGYGDIALKRCPEHGGPKEGELVVTPGRCHAHPKELNSLDYVAVVLDEAHRMMNPKAQMTRAAWAVCDAAPRVWGLTGTPGSKSVMENTWGLLRLVYGAEWPPKSKWCEYFAETGYNLYGFWEVGRLRPERETEFRKTYDALTRRVLKTQVLDLPPLLRGGPLERIIPMGKEQKASYRDMVEFLRIWSAEGEVTAQNLLVQTGRLTLLASASGVPGEDYGKIIGQKWVLNKHTDELELLDILDAQMELRLPSNKVDAVVDMIKSGDVAEGTVFQFMSSKLLYLVRDALVSSGCIERAEDFGVVAGDVSEAKRALAIDRFQAGKIPFFGFTTAAGGAGITLTRANTMVAVQRPWSSVQNAQARDRVHRIGSEIHSSVSIIDLVSEDTVEVTQLERLAENAEALEEVVRDKKKLLELLLG